MIEVLSIRKLFGSLVAVRDVSFSIGQGQCVGLLGPNGAGKSTTIKMITGFLPPSAGSIRVDGHGTIDDSIAARRLIGYLPESTPLYTEMRVRDMLDFRAKLYGLSRSERRSRIAAVLSQCWLTDVAHRRIGQLSKGYKQRTGLAAAMVHDPKVLVLDEPSSGLDPSQIRETRSLIRTLAQDRTVLVSSHILPEVEQTCDRVLIMARGRLRADGSPSELVSRLPEARTHVVEIAGDQAAVDRALAGIKNLAGDGESSVGVFDDGWTRVKVSPGSASQTRETDLRERVASICSLAGVRIRELRRATPTLEQVFLRVIESEEDKA